MRKTRDERNIGLARHIALENSRDPSTKVGALIVDDDNRPVGYGYNGFPRGVRDDPERYADRELKYKLVVHAEPNAILNAVGSVKGCTIYTWPLPPCSECAKLIIQSGIRRVVSPPLTDELKTRWQASCEITRMMFEEAGIVCEEIVDAAA